MLTPAEQLVVTVQPRAGQSDGKHGMIVEPFADSGGIGNRSGYRVRQDQFGRPAFFTPISPGSTCFHNGAVNDTLRLVADGCDVRIETTVPLAWRFDARGGAGGDTMSGTPRIDTLRGEGGDDLLRGEGGDDLLEGGADGDSLGGGAGFDTVTYESAPPSGSPTLGVTVQLDGLANDGSPVDGPGGQRDNVFSDVERVLGSPRNDTLFGFPGNQTLDGRGGDDGVFGGGDDDRVFGGSGDDGVNGQNGLDELSGGAGDDTVNARDGVAETAIFCGPGTDTAILDTQDRLPLSVTDPRTGVVGGASCESVDQSPLDDGPPGRALHVRRRRGGRNVSVKVACPRSARVACRGVLTLRHPKSARVLARGRYGVRLGERRLVSLTVRRLPRRVVAEMREQGASKKGPRFSRRVVRVRR